MGAVAIFLVVVAIVAVVGIVFGRVVAAPVIQKVADRADADEESGDEPA